MIKNINLKQLNQFIGIAAINTYAGAGQENDPEEPGFKELEYKQGDWYYKDSYTGFFQSWGREQIWYKQKPIWSHVYGGGMEKDFQDNAEFSHQTFDFKKSFVQQ